MGTDRRKNELTLEVLKNDREIVMEAMTRMEKNK